MYSCIREVFSIIAGDLVERSVSFCRVLKGGGDRKAISATNVFILFCCLWEEKGYSSMSQIVLSRLCALHR
jgi:hypothetical protein